MSASSMGCSWIRFSIAKAWVPRAIKATSLAVGSLLSLPKKELLRSLPPVACDDDGAPVPFSAILLGRRFKMGAEKILSLERMEDLVVVVFPLVRRVGRPGMGDEAAETDAALLENEAAGSAVPDGDSGSSKVSEASLALSMPLSLPPRGCECDRREANGAASRRGVSGGEVAEAGRMVFGTDGLVRERVRPSKKDKPGMFCIDAICCVHRVLLLMKSGEECEKSKP
jgi:hypothetical protein